MFRNLKRIIRYLVLRGGNVECCLCNKKYLTFLPSGDEIKAHSRCPGCYSTDRNRQLWLTIKPLIINKGKALKILHIAPERPISLQILKLKSIEYHAIDKFDKGYNYPSYVKPMDLTNLQYSNNAFDLFLCCHVLEHIPDDKTAIKELYRILKPGGTGFIMIPYFPEQEKTTEDSTVTSPELRKKLFGQADHVRKYGTDFISRLQEAGFEVEIIDPENKYTYEQKVRFGLLNAEIFFRVSKLIPGSI